VANPPDDASRQAAGEALETAGLVRSALAVVSASPAGRRRALGLKHRYQVPMFHRIRAPNAEQASSTARLAVWLCSSSTGFTSTSSSDVRMPCLATSSIARWASR